MGLMGVLLKVVFVVKVGVFVDIVLVVGVEDVVYGEG